MPTTDEEKLIISLEARLSKYEREMKRATQISSQTARKIESDFSKLDRSMGRMGAGIKSFGAGLIGGLSAQALGRIIVDAAKAGAAIGDLAQQTGMAAEKIQILQHAANQTGSSTEQMTAALKQFGILTAKAATAGGDLKDVLDANGVAIKGNANLFEDYLRLIRDAPSDVERLRLVTLGFGKGNDELLNTFRDGPAVIQKWGDELNKIGGPVSQKAIDALGRLDDKFAAVMTGIKTSTLTMVASVEPAINAVADEVLQFVRQLEDMFETLRLFGSGEFGAALRLGIMGDDPLRPHLQELAQTENAIEHIKHVIELETIANRNTIGEQVELNRLLEKEEEIRERIRRLTVGGGSATGPGGMFSTGGATTIVPTEGGGNAFLKTRAVSERIAGRIDDLDKEFAEAVATLLQAFPALRITSAYRTFGEQAKLYAAYKAGTGGIAARPGSSLHEAKLAVDLTFNDLTEEEKVRARAMAEDLGLEFPVSLRVNDPGHLQSAEPGMRAAFTAADKAAEDAADRDKKAAEDAAAALKRKREDLEQILTAREQELAFAQLELDYTGKSAQALEEERIYLEEINRLKAANLTIDEAAVTRARQHAADLAGIHAAQLQAEKTQAATIDQLDAMRDLSSDVFGGIISDLRAGASAGEVFANVLDKIIGKLGDMAVNMLTTALFGPGGTAQLGLLGGLIPGRQHGGAVEAGSPYVVGETQPELFVPNVSGRIMPSVPRGLGGAAASIVNGQLRGVIDINPSPLFLTSVAQTSARMIAENNRRMPSYLADRQRRGI